MRREMSILGVIPARGGSKGIPRKNLADLCGRPLIQYTFEAALGSRELDRVVLSTDDEEIAAFGRRCGVEAPFVRPGELAGDRTPMVPVLQHAVQWLRREEGRTYDAVALLQPTSPLRRASDVDDALRAFREGDMDAIIGVCEPREHPYEMVIVGEKEAKFLIPHPPEKGLRQAFPTCYFVNGAVYALLTPVLLGQGTLFPERTGIYIMDWLSSWEVDTPLDLKIAASLMSLRQSEGEAG